MLLPVALHEFRYHTRSIQALIPGALLFGLAFLFTANGVEFQSTARGGNVHVNSPYVIAHFLVLSTYLALFVAPSFLANSVLRDAEHQFDGILFSTPIRKRDYLIGRFLGAFAALTLVLCAAPVGMLCGTFWPWAAQETLGANIPSHYVLVFVGLVLPPVFTLSALIAATATWSRSLLYSYLAAIGILILAIAASTSEAIGIRWDPLSINALSEQTRYWTAAERNSLLPTHGGSLLMNQLTWLAISLGALVTAWIRFDLRKTATGIKARPITAAATDQATVPRALTDTGSPTWNTGTQLRQLLFRTRFEVVSVAKSGPFLFLMGASFFLLFFALTGRETLYGVNTYPVTRVLLAAIQQTLTFALMGVLAFYSADLIWRERTSRFNEIIDALPAPNWVFVVSKLIALALILHAIVLLGILIAIALQILSGYDDIQPGLYLQRGLIYYPMAYVDLAVLTCFLQVLSKKRLLGMLYFVVFLALLSVSRDIFGIEDLLLSYGLPGVEAPLSDMNANGRFAVAGWWARVYWASMAGLLLIATYALWNRGTLQPLRYRLRAARLGRSRGLVIGALVLLVLGAGSGGFIFYNTHVLNRYRTLASIEALQLAYEKKYRQFENLPMPRVTAITIDVDLFPYERRVEARSIHVLENKTGEPLHAVHLSFPIGVEVADVTLQGAVKQSADDELGYWIFALESPMQPGECRPLSFRTRIEQHGFVHARPDTRLVRNGTFIGNHQLTPYIGFHAGNMIKDRNARRDHGLEPLARMPALEDTGARDNNYLRQDSDLIDFETTVSTVAHQIAIAPGTLVKKWTNAGRRYFTYRMSAPIMNFYSFLSADYTVARDRWHDVDIEVFHHPGHGTNVGRMIESVKDSLALYSQIFGPYQYKQLRILEFPAYRTFAQSFPNTIPFSEGIGFIADVSDPHRIDLPYYVTAHEVAHQWWAHQMISANAQGGTLLTETLSQYSALLVMERKYGVHHVRRFLKAELDRYLSGRGDDAEGELPLARVENQSYIHYRKGALILYALKDTLGEDTVNHALRRLLGNFAHHSAPYAVSTDLIALLKEEAGPAHDGLIEDFFEKITLYDLRLDNAHVAQRADGRFDVTLDVRARKLDADALGKETPVPFNLSVDIGLFLKSPADEDFADGDVVLLEKQVVDPSTSTIRLVVDRRPNFAGIDPYNKLIDRDPNDNLGNVEPADNNATAS